MSGYIGTAPVPQAVQRRENFTATAGQTSFATVSYTVGFVSVFLNGIHLLDGTDYTASNGSDIVLTAGASAGDVVEVISFETFEVASQTFTGTTTVDVLTTTGAFTSVGIDDNATSTAITIDASENVGINDTNPFARLTVGAPNSGDNLTLAGFYANSGATGGSSASLKIIAASDLMSLVTGGGDDLAFGTASTERMRIDSSGALLHGTTTAGSAGAGDIVVNGGVYLGGTAAANLLDDYEEGTWSPVFSDATSGGNTATANGGKRGLYTKIGNQVTVSCHATNLDRTGMTGANDLRIQGLPFTPTSYSSPNHYWTGGTRLGAVSFNTNGFVTAYVSDAVTYVRLGETISGSSIDGIICSQLTSGAADVSFTMTYETT